jgi:hypothetical protein
VNVSALKEARFENSTHVALELIGRSAAGQLSYPETWTRDQKMAHCWVGQH